MRRKICELEHQSRRSQAMQGGLSTHMSMSVRMKNPRSDPTLEGMSSHAQTVQSVRAAERINRRVFTRQLKQGPSPTPEATDFGQSRFGHPICPIWANPILANPFLDLVCVMRPKGWGPNLEEWAPKGGGPEGWGAQNFRAFFFPLPPPVSLFFSAGGRIVGGDPTSSGFVPSSSSFFDLTFFGRK